MATTEKLPSRLHHNAFLTKDQEATRAFYEDLIGLPLVATWSEADELFGAERVYCHTFFGLGDGSALAFFQFANQSDQDLFDPELTPSPFRHVALRVTPELQQEIHDRLTTAAWKPEGTYVLEHGYCRSLYTEDPNGLLLEFTADVAGGRRDRRRATERCPRDAEALARGRSHQQQRLPVTRARWAYVRPSGSGTGSRDSRAHSSVMARAVSRRRGRCRRLSALTDVSAACTVTFTAATVVPGRVPDRRGDRPDAEREALVGEGPAAVTDLGEVPRQLPPGRRHPRDDLRP